MTTERARAWAEISLDNLEHNYRVLRACAPSSRFLGVVKADAYGHGALAVAKRLEKLGADYLAVACLAEGEELRRGGILTPILILGATAPELADAVVAGGFTQALFDLPLAQALSRAAQQQGRTARVHIKVDTGMSRLGILAHETQEAARMVEQLCELPHLEAEGIFTHFADADGDEAYTMLQFTRFLDLLVCLEERWERCFSICHCANSAAVLHYPCTHMDMVRPGLALYGCYPTPHRAGLELKPVMALKCRVATVRDLPADTPVSYGCTARVGAHQGRIAVLPVGYADGLHRTLSNRGRVYLDGKPRPILGRICMDMCMVALEQGSAVRPGDVAELFGPNLPVEEPAGLAGTISYELLCGVAPRVPRVLLD